MTTEIEWSLWEKPEESCVVLADAAGLQAKFAVDDIMLHAERAPPFGADPFEDLRRMIRLGLRPYHVDGGMDNPVDQIAAEPLVLEHHG